MRMRLWPAYIGSAAAGAAAYFLLSAHIRITLLPYTKALKLLFGFHFYEISGGYEAAGIGFVISKSCSGVNLFMSLYTILLACVLRYARTFRARALTAGACLLAALCIAYFVTFARIVVSLPFCDSPHFKLIHTVISMCVFFGAGLWVYSRAQRMIGRIAHATAKKAG